MKRMWLVLAMAVFLSGCAIHQIDDQKLALINRVGVISLLGDRACLSSMGTVLGSWEYHTASVESWDIDRHIEGLVEQEIRQGTRFRFVPVSNRDVDFFRLYLDKELCAIAAKFFDYPKYDLALIADPISKIMAAQKLDALVLVLAAPTETDVITSRSNTIVNYGLHHNSFIGLRQTITYASIRMIVVGRDEAEELSQVSLIDWENMDNDYWEKGFENLSTEELKVIEASIKEALKTNIQNGLRKTGLM